MTGVPASENPIVWFTSASEAYDTTNGEHFIAVGTNDGRIIAITI